MTRLTYVVGVEDYAAFSERMVAGPQMRAKQWKQLALGALIWPLVTVAFFLVLDTDRPIDVRVLVGVAVLAFLIGGLLMLVSFLIYPSRVRRMARAMLGSEPTESFLGTQELSIDAAGLTLEGGGVVSHYSWPAIKRLDETNGHLFIMTGRIHGIIVPKRDLDPQNLAELKRRVRDAIPAS